MKFGTLNRHKVGQIRSYRAVDKCIRRRILRSFIWDGSQVVGKPSWWEKSGKTVWKASFFKFLTVFCHQVGRIKVAGAFDKCIRCRILRSFICDGSWGVVFFQKVGMCFKKPSNIGTWDSKMQNKVKRWMKWVWMALNLELLIWDLENAVFGYYFQFLLRGKVDFSILFASSGFTGPPVNRCYCRGLQRSPLAGAENKCLASIFILRFLSILF